MAKDDKTTEDAGILQLPGHEHLFHIRKALNARHAAVMVGSGFSMTADNGERLPNWAQLAAKFAEGIDPGRQAATGPMGTSNMLRMAEEFEALHGRAALDALMRKEIPDAGAVHPGHLHQTLLSLSWVDVFTTNYDTLLERAYYEDQKLLKPKIKARYQVVVTDQDIPLSRAEGHPRIIKLHGSFTSSRPFIVTEEDYRTYPEVFAPFVNMVQQSLLENVLCLIGFSGDDPNFQLWSGWVRDRVGKHTPPIYLITASKISPGLRLILSRRYIYPIEIAQLGQEPGKTEVNYRKAYHRLLNFLAAHHEPRPIEWARERGPSDEPKTPEQLVSGVDELRATRLAYPGWLFPPPDVLSTFRYNIGWMGRAFWDWKKEWAGKFNALTRLALLFELHWWERMVSNKFLADWAGDVEELLDSLVPVLSDEQAFRREVAGLPAAQVHPIGYFREAWKGLALFLLQERRRTWGDEGFMRLVFKLRALKGPLSTDELQVAVTYHKAISRLELFDPEGAKAVLDAWEKADGDPYWAVRKAGLLAEQGSCKEALQLGLQGLKAIRLQILSDGETPRLLSQEQWAELILQVCQRQISWDDIATSARSTKPTSGGATDDASLPSDLRSQAYEYQSGPIGTGIDETKEELTRDEKTSERTDHPWKILAWFRNQLHVGAAVPENGIDPDDALQEARLFRDLADQVGLPSGVSNSSLASEEFVYAAEVDARRGVPPSRYIGDLLRSCDEKVLKPAYYVLSRTAIASWDYAVVKDLYVTVRSTLFMLITRAGPVERDDSEEGMIRFGLELLPRLFGRIEDEALRKQAVGDMLAWYISPALYKRPSTWSSFGKFYDEMVGALSKEERHTLALGAMTQPVIFDEQRRFADSQWRDWPDPVLVLVRHRFQLDPDDGHESDAVELIGKAASEKGEVYARYIARLDYLLRQKHMGKETKRAFADLVWKDARESGLPETPGFLPGVLIDWPAPVSIDVADRLDKVIASRDVSALDYSQAANHLNNLLYLVRHAEAPLRSFNLAAALGGATAWWTKLEDNLDKLGKRSAFSELALYQPRYLARVLSYALYRACLFASDAEKPQVAALAAEMRKSAGVLGYRFPYLLVANVLLGSSTPEDCLQALRGQVYDNDKLTSIDSMASVVECVLEPQLRQAFPASAISILVDAVSSRRMPHALDALRAIDRVVRKDAALVTDGDLKSLAVALAAIDSSSTYAVSDSDGIEYRNVVPEVRRAAAEIVGLLAWRIDALYSPKDVRTLFPGFFTDPFLVVQLAVAGRI